MLLTINQVPKSNITTLNSAMLAKNHKLRPEWESKNFLYVSKNGFPVMFQAKKDSFTKKEKESMKTVLQSPKLLKNVLAAVAISTAGLCGMTSCTGSGSSNNSYQSGEYTEAYDSTDESADTSAVDAGSSYTQSNEELSTDEWLGQWNQAWGNCYEAIAAQRGGQQTNINPNEDFMAQSLPQPVFVPAEDVFKVMTENYPELCSYLETPEYKEKLQEQLDKTAKAFQELYQKIQQDDERREQNTELREQELEQRQALRDQREYYFQRERELIRLKGQIDRIVGD